MSKSTKRFVKVATNIRYYGESKLPFWRRIFFRAPRVWVSPEFVTRRKAGDAIPPSFEQFGVVFEPMACESTVKRVRR